MKVKILRLNEDGEGQRVVGDFFLDADGDVAWDAPSRSKEDTRTMKQLFFRRMADPTNYGYLVDADLFPREWLAALPANLTNGYLNAELVEAL